MKESPKVGTSQKTADTTKTYIQPTIGAWVKDLKKKKASTKVIFHILQEEVVGWLSYAQEDQAHRWISAFKLGQLICKQFLAFQHNVGLCWKCPME